VSAEFDLYIITDFINHINHTSCNQILYSYYNDKETLVFCVVLYSVYYDVDSGS
jgi:hypothetical protein